MIRLNLLLPGRAASSTIRPLTSAACVTTTCVALGVYWWHLHASAGMHRAQSLAVDAQFAEVASSAERLDRARTRHRELTAELRRLTLILDDRHTSAELLEAISRSLTDGLWLTEVKRSASSLQLDGRASSLEAIANLIRDLDGNLSFVDPPAIRSAASEALEGLPVLRFQVVGELAPAGDRGNP